MENIKQMNEDLKTLEVLSNAFTVLDHRLKELVSHMTLDIGDIKTSQQQAKDINKSIETKINDINLNISNLLKKVERIEFKIKELPTKNDFVSLENKLQAIKNQDLVEENAKLTSKEENQVSTKIDVKSNTVISNKNEVSNFIKKKDGPTKKVIKKNY